MEERKMLSDPDQPKKIGAIFFMEIFASCALICAYRRTRILQNLNRRIFLCSTFPLSWGSSWASLIARFNGHMNTRTTTEPKPLPDNGYRFCG
jgi:hypothetical protein